jgi:integrase
MARHVTYVKLETRSLRLKLKPGRQAYWRNIILNTLSLGYQRKRAGAPGRWLVRVTLGGDRYQARPLGLADDYGDADGSTVLDFNQALVVARTSYRGEGERPMSVVTVADAIEEYIAWLKVHRATATDAEGRSKKHILPMLGRVRLSDLTSADITRWRDRMAEAPALKRTALGLPQQFKARPTTAEDRRVRRASANRVLTTLKAALNKAFRDSHVSDDTAWRRVKPFEKVSAARPGYLTIEEAGRVINAADPEFRPILCGGLQTGARYGELIELHVRDYHRGKIHIARSKGGKARDIVLPDEGLKFFDSITVGRSPDAFLFHHADGSPWDKSQQARPMRDACARAKVKPVGFHQLRHTWASHAVMNGMPLMVVARNLGHATTIMVERHYGHLAASYVDEVTRAHAPRFGLPTPDINVAALRGRR